MSDFSDEFEFRLRKLGAGQIAEGDWYDDEITLQTAPDANQDSALETLSELYRNWRAWRGELQEAIEEAHGDPGDYWLEAITTYDKGYFEIEFSAPDLFDDELALAVGTLGHGFEEVGVGG